MELSRDEVFNRLTENGKYSGIVAEEYNGMHLGLDYIMSGTIKMEHSKPKEFTIHETNKLQKFK